jgi:hypothetical protein
MSQGVPHRGDTYFRSKRKTEYSYLTGYSTKLQYCIAERNEMYGSESIVEHKDKDQAARPEIAESSILCGHQAYKSHIKSIIHDDDQVEVAKG